jgi:hypothetical protein
MIKNSPGGYWSTGITLTYTNGHHGHAWSAVAEFYDDGFANDDPDAGQISTEGVIRTRRAVRNGVATDGLTAALDALIADATGLGIEFKNGLDGTPQLYYRGDGEDKDFPPPNGYRELLAAQAQRIGWGTFGYETAETAGA